MPPPREDHAFHSGVDVCAAWVYRAAGDPDVARPVVVLGPGLGTTRRTGLERYARHFAEAGITAVTFDHRYFGDSSGEPRELLSVPAQLADWEAAVAFARMLPGADPDRIAIWGSGLGGGHVIATAARHPELSAAIAQRPFTDGLAPAGPRGLGRLALPSVRDGLAALTGRPTTRTASYRPGRDAARVRVPLLVAVAERDSVTPPERILHHLAALPTADVHRYDAGDLDLDRGAVYEQVIKDQTAFLERHLRPTGP
jgi:dienelactone hydrolase